MELINGRVNNKSKIIYGPKTKKKTYSVPVEIISNNCGGFMKIKIIVKTISTILMKSLELIINIK